MTRRGWSVARSSSSNGLTEEISFEAWMRCSRRRSAQGASTAEASAVLRSLLT